DRISSLPGHIVDKILSFLSLGDAVRTCILSRKWRYKWTTLPCLVFDNQSVAVAASNQDQTKSRLVNVIDHMLLLHSGPVQRFKLSHRDLHGISDIDRWILFLSRGSVKEFILEIWKGHRYKLPSAAYSCQKLTHLELFNCLLKPPLEFSGFRSLRSLDLQHITMDQHSFERMVSGCPVLERLTVMNFDGFTLLNVQAPNLVFFDVGGAFEDVAFRDTFRLAVVSIALYENNGFERSFASGGGGGNIVKFFASLPHIQRLEVQSFFLKYLAAGSIPVELPAPCTNLNYLSIRINFNDLSDNLATLCLLRSSPNLHELEILVRTEEQFGSWKSLTVSGSYYDFALFRLRSMRVVGVSGQKLELDFVKFVLESAPVLEKVTVKPTTAECGWDVVKELLRFRRASMFAEIVYLDP
ncbi:hypothetical protein M569_09037, partial [Genlisea aurea]